MPSSDFQFYCLTVFGIPNIFAQNSNRKDASTRAYCDWEKWAGRDLDGWVWDVAGHRNPTKRFAMKKALIWIVFLGFWICNSNQPLAGPSDTPPRAHRSSHLEPTLVSEAASPDQSPRSGGLCHQPQCLDQTKTSNVRAPRSGSWKTVRSPPMAI